MRVPIVGVRDTAANAFNRPFAVQSIGVAIRSFGTEVNRQDANNTLYTNPSDFELWYLADFDEESGDVVPVERRMISRAVDVRVE